MIKIRSAGKQLLTKIIIVFGLLVWCSGIIYAKTEEVNRPYRIVKEETTGELIFIQNAPHRQDQQKPIVAVALGGGGARALVNVGILKALEEERIPVDLVVGSSMGAIVAVLYGSGMPIATIEELVTTDLLPSLFDLNFPFIYSVIDTRRVNFFMEKISPHQRMEEFPIMTALLSYDLTHGVKYIHTSGRISREIQGSYSIPLFFPVVAYDDGLYLMDPGILELTPSQAAKVLGADVIISTTAFDALPYTTYDLPVRAWTRFINIQKERNSQDVIERYSDLTINCEVGDYSFMDYHLAAEFIALGYREAKKQIPVLKQVLATQNIPLRADKRPEDQPESLAYEQNRARLVTDLKYDRLRYDFTRIKPIVYYGKDHSFFQPELLKTDSLTLQYGLLWQTGPVYLKLLTEGKNFDVLEAKLKIIGLTPSIDLTGQARYEKEASGEGRWYGLDLTYYRPNYALAAGWASFNNAQYLHGGVEFELNWVKTKLKGEVDLYTPITGRPGITGTKYVFSQVISSGVGENFTLQPRLVVSNTTAQEVLAPPIIYRGFAPALPNQELFIQSSFQFDYHYRFTYSLELLQCIQLKEISFFTFADLCYNRQAKTATAAGIGAACDLNLLGIKPFIFGGYLAYDFQKASWRSALSLDLSF